MKNCEKYRAGNFLFVKEKRGDMSYITCSTLTKDWHIRLREDTTIYVLVLSMVNAKETDRLASLATLWYGHTVMMHSKEYFSTVAKALVDEMNAAGVPDVANKENEKALQEVVDMERKEEELKMISDEDKDSKKEEEKV